MFISRLVCTVTGADAVIGQVGKMSQLKVCRFKLVGAKIQNGGKIKNDDKNRMVSLITQRQPRSIPKTKYLL